MPCSESPSAARCGEAEGRFAVEAGAGEATGGLANWTHEGVRRWGREVVTEGWFESGMRAERKEEIRSGVALLSPKARTGDGGDMFESVEGSSSGGEDAYEGGTVRGRYVVGSRLLLLLTVPVR